MLILLLVIGFSLATTLLLGLLWPFRQGSPIFWFAASLWLMAVGTFLLVDLDIASDRLYVTLFFVALVAFGASAIACVNLFELRASLASFIRRPERENSPDERAITITIMLISGGATILYYYLVGYNVFILLVTGQLDADYSELRLATYGEGEYFAPGYFNQFKNVLLPLTVCIVARWIWQSGHRTLFYSFVAIAAPLTLVALAGTGQRAFIVYTFGALMFGLVLHQIGRPGGRLPMGKIFAAAVPLAAVFGLMTGAYVADPSGEGSLAATVLSRFTSIQQESALIGFRYTYPMPIANFFEWWQGITGIIPGVEGSTLAHEIFAVMYGSMTGTAPPSLVGSAYYNGGILGLIVVYAAIGFAYALLYKRFLDGDRTVLRSFAYGFLFFYLSIWVVEGPTNLFDNGALTIMLFLALAKLRVGRGAPQRARRMASGRV